MIFAGLLTNFHKCLNVHLQIASNSPPVEDIPEGLIDMVDALIRRAWTVDPNDRPTANDLLEDQCFSILHCKLICVNFFSHENK